MCVGGVVFVGVGGLSDVSSSGTPATSLEAEALAGLEHTELD